MIKTFRGLLPDGGQDIIRLSTKKGKIGYRVKNFMLFANAPGTDDYEHVVKLFKVIQSSVTGTVDFSDGNLLAAGYLEGSGSAAYSDQQMIMFEHEIFNQDIFITHDTIVGASPVNYYLELETMPLTDNAAAVSTLRDIRLNPQVGA